MALPKALENPEPDTLKYYVEVYDPKSDKYIEESFKDYTTACWFAERYIQRGWEVNASCYTKEMAEEDVADQEVSSA